MGVSILTFDLTGGTYIQPGRIEDDTWNPLGGPILNWPARGTLNSVRKESHPIFQVNGEVYCLSPGLSSTTEVYKLVRDCLTITVDESTVGSAAYGDPISNSGGSGATGTFQMFHPSSGTLYYTPGSGTFASGETIDFDLPSTGSSVTTNSAPQQSNGGGDDTGEWIIGAIANVSNSSSRHFGPVTGISASGDSVVALGAYSSSAINIFDPGAETWSHVFTSFNNQSAGQVTLFDNIAWWITQEGTVLYITYYYFTFNASGVASYTAYGGDIFTIDDRLFLAVLDTVNNLYIYEWIVGSFQQVLFKANGGPQAYSGVTAIVNDGAVYIITATTDNTDWQINKLILPSSGAALKWSTTPNDEALGKAIISEQSPADNYLYHDSDIYSPTTLGANNPKWTKFYEQETNGVNTKPRIMMFLKEAEISGNHHRFVWPDPTSLAQTYTWNGTTTVTASSAPGDLVQGDFLILDSDTQRRSFEVTSADPQTTSITIVDPEGVGIPTSTGSEASSKEGSMTAISKTTTLNKVFCPSQDTGGAEYLWKANRLTGRITRNYGLTSATRVFFKVTHPTGADVKVKLYYTTDLSAHPTTLASIDNILENDSNLPVGATISANQVLGIPGDGTTEYSVDWDFDGDGVSTGTDVKLRIYVEDDV
jgi:hypothetical protein